MTSLYASLPRDLLETIWENERGPLTSAGGNTQSDIITYLLDKAGQPPMSHILCIFLLLTEEFSSYLFKDLILLFTSALL